MTKKYEVGYGKPPKSGQFKKGQSGNPKGRRKGTKNTGAMVKKIMDQKITITVNGRNRSVSVKEAAVQKLAVTALKGTPRERIDAFKALHYYAPDLLKGEEASQNITVTYVLPDGKTMEDYDDKDREECLDTRKVENDDEPDSEPK